MLYTVIGSPLGDLFAARDEGGITALYLPTGRNAVRPDPTCTGPTRPDPTWQRADDAFDDVRTQLGEYFQGRRQTFELPLNPSGTKFQQLVWMALRSIPFGETTSYSRTAAAIGHPNGARAVGAANGQNPISIIVGCHRVVGADGSLTGYGGGLDAKRWLLAHEARCAGLTLL
jgi:methylated-DNA-[protein]-cysteine S-methyltransferase